METLQFHITIVANILSGAIEQTDIHKKMPKVFNVGLISLWNISKSNCFYLISKFSFFHEYASEIIFILDQWMKGLDKLYH